ncbi:mitochondrial FAD carrier protein flx1 [Cryptotrichosporon argae]
MATSAPSLFGDPSIDHAVAGFGAGTVATLCMHPLDLVKVRFQLAGAGAVSSTAAAQLPVASSSRLPHPAAGASTAAHRVAPSASGAAPASIIGVEPAARRRFGTAVYYALADAVRQDGWRGLYRGLIPNLAGNAGSWGLYFLFYNTIKKRMQGGDPAYRTSAGQHLLAAAEASAITALLTNPIWVVKTRVFATPRNDPRAYRGLIDGLSQIYRHEGVRGLYRGSLLALVGVSNGSIQFATYEEIKRRRTEAKRRAYERAGREWRTEDEKLTNTEYILASGSSKFVAIALTYPYQVVRARIQNAPPTQTPTIPAVVRATWAHEGARAFYKGLGTNALRILPGTCTTFVVYENLVWLFRRLARDQTEGALV